MPNQSPFLNQFREWMPVIIMILIDIVLIGVVLLMVVGFQWFRFSQHLNDSIAAVQLASAYAHLINGDPAQAALDVAARNGIDASDPDVDVQVEIIEMTDAGGCPFFVSVTVKLPFTAKLIPITRDITRSDKAEINCEPESGSAPPPAVHILP